MDFKEIASKVHQNAKDKGWWSKVRDVPELLCLVHSEVSEALEAYRNYDTENFKEELADIVIRVMDMAEGFDIDLEEAILKKHDFNKSREYRHGGKVC